MGERLAQRDVAIGLVLAFALGLGLLFLHYYTAFATQATTLLFGNVLAVDTAHGLDAGGAGRVSLGMLAAIARPLLFASLQPELAEAKGVSLRRYAVLFLVVVALTTAACAQIVGVLLVFALMVGPAATAQRLTCHAGERRAAFRAAGAGGGLGRPGAGLLHRLAEQLLHRAAECGGLRRGSVALASGAGLAFPGRTTLTAERAASPWRAAIQGMRTHDAG